MFEYTISIFFGDNYIKRIMSLEFKILGINGKKNQGLSSYPESYILFAGLEYGLTFFIKLLVISLKWD